MTVRSRLTPSLQAPASRSSFPARAAACLVCVLLAIVLDAQTPKYGVTVEIDDKKADFAAFKTYAWQRGQASFDKTIDTQIVAAVDATPEKLEATIKSVVAQMFERYPTRQKR